MSVSGAHASPPLPDTRTVCAEPGSAGTDDAFDNLPADTRLKVLTTGIPILRMNSLTERWTQTCRKELLDRTLIRNRSHPVHH